MEADKPSRDDVKAKREAKKLAKLAKKKAGNNKGDAEPTKLESVEEPNEMSMHRETLTDKTSAEPDPKTEKGEMKGKSTANIQALLESGESVIVRSAEPVQKSEGESKSKAALRMERRAKQEAQRAAKDAARNEPKTSNSQTPAPQAKKPAPAIDVKLGLSAPKTPNKTHTQKATIKLNSNQPKLLSHLKMDNRSLPDHIFQNAHQSIVELGVKYAMRAVSGSNARCIALLQAIKKVILDFVTPREKEFSRAMETKLNDSMAYLNSFRPSSVSMINALKHVKSHLTQLTADKTPTDEEARRKLCEVIDTFIKEQIDVAGEAICNAVAMKISNGDTIAIYGCSSLLLRILEESHSQGKDFEVIVVDGGPLFEGREMCRRLVSQNIKCTYVLLPAFSFVVSQTTKVLLGAHALLANGCVMSRSGSALVAMVAKAYNVPVIVCCETYKFCERVQADAFVHNELGSQDTDLGQPMISLMYDMTPPAFVDAVATELAILPCTSVPVILRVKPSDVSTYYY